MILTQIISRCRLLASQFRRFIFLDIAGFAVFGHKIRQMHLNFAGFWLALTFWSSPGLNLIMFINWGNYSNYF